MRLLIDSCLPRRLVPALAEFGHDVVHVQDWGDDPGDEAIIAAAYRENRIIVTQDKDFGALAVRRGQAAIGILRIKRIPNRLFVTRIIDALARHESDLRDGAVLTVETGRLRIRRLPAL